MILLPVSFLAISSDGSGTSLVTKLLRQKYLPGMPVVFNSSSKTSFLNPASLQVRMSVTTKDRVFGLTATTTSGIGNISFSLKYFAYFSTLSFSLSLGVFLGGGVKFATTRTLALQVLSQLAG